MFEKLLCKKLKIEELQLSSKITENKEVVFESHVLGTKEDPTTVKIINPQTPDRYLKLYCYNEWNGSDGYDTTTYAVVEAELVSPEKTIREIPFSRSLVCEEERWSPSEVLKNAAKHCSKKGAAYTPVIMGIEALRKEMKKEEKRLDKLKEEYKKRKEQESLKQKLNSFIRGQRIR